MLLATHDTAQVLLDDLGLTLDQTSPNFQRLANSGHKYLKDLRINVSNVLKLPNLTPVEANLLAYATAVNARHDALSNALEARALAAGATAEQVSEVVALVSLMNMNNVFYRFRHFMDQEYYETTPAGLKMSLMMNPVLGKELFELISLGVSALNGCERCVTSHEASLRQLGTSQARVYDAIRLVSVFQSLVANI